MNIIYRNFYKLIRIGLYDQQETVEPMSAFKWGKLLQLAIVHDMVRPVYQGMQKSKNQFFLNLTDKQWKIWDKTVQELKAPADTDDDAFLSPDHLTNPVLNLKLQNILDDEHSDMATRQLLLTIIRIARHILNEGMPVKELSELGLCLMQKDRKIDYPILRKWLKSIGFVQMAQLEGSLLIHLFRFEADEIPFLEGKQYNKVEKVALELTEFTNTHIEDFTFSQDDESIFVHTSNSSAVLGHIRRSARYFRYLPSETVTNFFATFARSLRQIEE
jgi:hypothetical protein